MKLRNSFGSVHDQLKSQLAIWAATGVYYEKLLGYSFGKEISIMIP